jgi:hypothetical protein
MRHLVSLGAGTCLCVRRHPQIHAHTHTHTHHTHTLLVHLLESRDSLKEGPSNRSRSLTLFLSPSINGTAPKNPPPSLSPPPPLSLLPAASTAATESPPPMIWSVAHKHKHKHKHRHRHRGRDTSVRGRCVRRAGRISHSGGARAHTHTDTHMGDTHT